MARRRRRARSESSPSPTTDKKDDNWYKPDDTYQYFHLGHLETQDIGAEVEKFLIDNGVDAEKGKTLSGCLSFRWEKGKYDENMLNNAFQVSNYNSLPYLYQSWVKLAVKPAKTGKTRRRRRKS